MQNWIWLKFLGTIQVLRQQRSGWMGSENGNFFWFTVLFMLCVGGPKKTITCWRNTWMVPYETYTLVVSTIYDLAVTKLCYCIIGILVYLLWFVDLNRHVYFPTNADTICNVSFVIIRLYLMINVYSKIVRVVMSKSLDRWTDIFILPWPSLDTGHYF